MSLWNLEASPQCCVTELKLKQHCKKCVKSNEALLLGHWPLFHMSKKLSCKGHSGPRERRKSLFTQRLFSQGQVDLNMHRNKIQEESLLLLMSKIRVPGNVVKTICLHLFIERAGSRLKDNFKCHSFKRSMFSYTWPK